MDYPAGHRPAAAIIAALMPFPPIALVLTLTSVFFIAMKGNRIVVTLFAVDLGAGPLQTGILFALHGIFPFLLAIRAGRIADRFDNRLLMYWGLAIYAIAMMLPFLWPGMIALYLCAAIGGFTSMLFVLATQNYIGSLATTQTRTKYFSYYAIGESVGQVIGPVILGYAIDHSISSLDSGGLTLIALVFLANALLTFGGQYSQTVCLAFVGQKVLEKLRIDLFSHTQRLSLRFFDTNEVGILMSRVQNDVLALQELLTNGFFSALQDVLSLLIIVYFMLDRKSTRLNSSHIPLSRMPSSA